MRSLRSRFVYLVLVFALVLVPAAGAQYADLYTLDLVLAPSIDHSVAVRGIDIAADVLDNTEFLGLALPEGAVLTATRSGVERRAYGMTWRGFLDTGDRVVITRHKGLLAGAFWLDGRVFEIQPNGGAHLLVELDPASFPPCATGADQVVDNLSDVVPPSHPKLDEGHHHASHAHHAIHRDHGGAVTEGGTVNMDVMVVYTPQARAAAGGTASIEATSQAAVDASNTGFIDSEGDGRFTLVHAFETAYNDSNSLNVDLNWVANNAEVAEKRDLYGADMVGLIVENGGGGCGIGFVMRNPGPGFAGSAFQVTDRGCAVGNLTYAHEHGHNMGLEHDPANSSAFPNSASYPYSFGHFVSGSYRTIMSYSNQCVGGCTRVAHWSNPDIDHNGVPTGIAGQRHNQLAGNQTAPIVALFETAPVFIDGFESGDTTSWSSTVD
ncbi:MAG: M12 family metallo-peptidase [Acidobacteriota bacterium]